MTTEPTTSRQNPMKVIFNYQNVFFSFFYDDADACVHRSREYAMNYVLSGEMVLDDGHRQIHAGKGECVFIPRDHRVTMYKKAFGGEQYCGIYMCFTRCRARGEVRARRDEASSFGRDRELVCFDDSLLQSGGETAGRRDAPEIAGRIAGPASYRQALHDRVVRLQHTVEDGHS